MRRFRIGALIFAGVVAASGTAFAGAGELSLDRAAVTDLVAAGMPGAVQIPMPALGEVAVRLLAPRRVEFVAGGIEAPIGFAVDRLGLEGQILVRYVPKVDARDGTIRLVAVRAEPEVPVRLPVDLAPYLPPVEFPRQLAWTVDGGGAPFDVVVNAQDVEIGPERVVLEFGLATRMRRP